MNVVILQSVYDFTDDPKRIEEILAFLKKHGLSESAFKVVAPLQNAVVEGKIDPVQIPARLKERLQISDEQAFTLAKDFVKGMLLPIRQYLPSVEAVAKQWNLDAADLTIPELPPPPPMLSSTPTPIRPRTIVNPAPSEKPRVTETALEAEVKAHEAKAQEMKSAALMSEADASKWKKDFVEKRAERFTVDDIRKRRDELAALRERFEKKQAEANPVPPPMPVKAQVRDVAAPRRLSGPLEELAEMSLAQFRRLGARPEDAAKEILETLDRLQAESYGRRLEGIAAWRKSPLFTASVALAAEAVQSGKTIAEVLHAHKAAREDTLSEAEWHAIIALNERVRV